MLLKEYSYNGVLTTQTRWIRLPMLIRVPSIRLLESTEALDSIVRQCLA